MPQVGGKSKYFIFEDVKEGVEGALNCSICLNPNSEGGQPVMTACKHVFHRHCIESWAKIKSECPECRQEFEESVQEEEKEEKGALESVAEAGEDEEAGEEGT